MFRKSLVSAFAMTVLAVSAASQNAAASGGGMIVDSPGGGNAGPSAQSTRASIIYTCTVYWQNAWGQTYETSAFPFYKYQWNGAGWQYAGYDDGGLGRTWQSMTSQGWRCVTYRFQFWRNGGW